MVRTLHFYCQGPRFNPCGELPSCKPGSHKPTSHKSRGGQKKKKKTVVSVEHNQAKCNKTRYACILYELVRLIQ